MWGDEGRVGSWTVHKVGSEVVLNAADVSEAHHTGQNGAACIFLLSKWHTGSALQHLFLCLNFIFFLSLSLICLGFSCFPFLLVFIDFSQTTGRVGSNLSYEQVRPMTQPGSACALSFIYESHCQCSAEQNNSDVIAFISFSVLTEWINPFPPPATASWRAETKIITKTFECSKTGLKNTLTKKISVLCGSRHDQQSLAGKG